MSNTHYIVGGIVLLIGIIALYFGRRSSKHAGLFSLYVEAQAASELAAGVPSFFSGSVVAAQTIKTPYSQNDCVYYSYKVEQEEQQRDDKGNVTTQWRTVASDSSGVQFVLQRGSDQVAVNPQDVDEVKGVQSQESLRSAAGAPGLPSTGIGGMLAAGAMTAMGAGQERITETYIAPGTQLTVGGQVFEDAGVKTLRHDTQYPLVFTTKTKDALVQSDRRGGYVGYVIGLLGLVGGIVLLALAKF